MCINILKYPCRQKTEALLRYHLYVDCMPSDGLQEIDREALVRVMNVAKSSKRLREPWYVFNAVSRYKRVC